MGEPQCFCYIYQIAVVFSLDIMALGTHISSTRFCQSSPGISNSKLPLYFNKNVWNDLFPVEIAFPLEKTALSNHIAQCLAVVPTECPCRPWQPWLFVVFSAFWLTEHTLSFQCLTRKKPKREDFLQENLKQVRLVYLEILAGFPPFLLWMAAEICLWNLSQL